MKLPKVYEAGKYEGDIYALWEKSQLFVANPESKKEHYSISMPPPNETGTLHIGHALFVTLEDILARHAHHRQFRHLSAPTEVEDYIDPRSLAGSVW